MKLTVEEKVKLDLALNLGELAAATGFSRADLAKLGIRKRDLPGGRMRRSDFWKKYHRGEFSAPKLAHASLSPLNDLQSIAGKLRAPRRSSDLLDASRLRGERPLRSTELQTLPA